MSDKEYAKVNVRVHKDLHNELLGSIPWGLRGHLMEAVLKLVLEAIRRDGVAFVGALLGGKFKLVRTDE